MEIVPHQKGEQLWSGVLNVKGEGRYEFETDGAVWPVITLEPVVQQWLCSVDGPRKVIFACHANHWGPWLRVNKVVN